MGPPRPTASQLLCSQGSGDCPLPPFPPTTALGPGCHRRHLLTFILWFLGSLSPQRAHSHPRDPVRVVEMDLYLHVHAYEPRVHQDSLSCLPPSRLSSAPGTFAGQGSPAPPMLPEFGTCAEDSPGRADEGHAVWPVGARRSKQSCFS